MNKTQYTPLPWAANQSELAANSPLCSIRGPNDAYQVCSDTNAANAAFIVRAVNSHAALVEALELLVSAADDDFAPQDYSNGLNKARAALEQAKEG